MGGIAVACLHRILDLDVIAKEELLELISKDPSLEVRYFLAPRCGSMDQLDSFLSRQSQNFMVENGMVCNSSAQLVRGSERAVDYYSEILRTYIEPCHYVNLRGHIGQAEEDIQDFIETFYHEKEFLNFLLAHPDDFVVFDDDKVHQADEMEERSVEFYKKCLENYGPGMYFTNFRGHYTHSKYVRQYIQQFYPGDEFLDFLRNNDDVFDADDGYVYLR